ncbi:MAG: hypothetical protein C0524_04380 [Rhodobacter sp.]|nr:hypothetical protein [Rhodobacter sp.]
MSKPTLNLGRGMATGISVTLSSYFLSRMVNFVTTVALARILSPAEMGIVATALLIVYFVDVVRDFGLRDAVVFQGADGGHMGADGGQAVARQLRAGGADGSQKSQQQRVADVVVELNKDADHRDNGGKVNPIHECPFRRKPRSIAASRRRSTGTMNGVSSSDHPFRPSQARQARHAGGFGNELQHRRIAPDAQPAQPVGIRPGPVHCLYR